MRAVSYPDPIAEPTPDHRVTTLPQPVARSPRSIVAVVAVLVVLGAGTSAVLLWPSRPAHQPDVSLTGLAEQVVVAYLHGDRTVLEATVASELPADLPADQYYVRSAAARSVTPFPDGWAVVVAVDRLAAVPGGFGDPRVRYYAVTLLHRPTGPLVAGLPAMVPAPAPPAVRAGPLPAPIDDDVSATVRSYLEWLLVGAQGPFDGRPVSPPPFDEVELTGLRSTDTDEGLAVTVTVEAVRSNGAVQPMQYHLLLVGTERSWDVSLAGS